MTNVKNRLSVDEHVARILEIDSKIRVNTLKKAEYILAASEEYPDRQETIAKKLGMTQGTFAKWIAIGKNKLISDFQDNLPSAFSILYHIVVLHNKYEKHHGTGHGYGMTAKNIQDNIISQTSSYNDIDILIKCLDGWRPVFEQTRNILGRDVNLGVMEKNFAPSELQEKYPQLEIEGFGWFDLNESITDDNLGVRTKGTEDAPDLRNDLKVSGWDTSFIPPIINLRDGTYLDGRTRGKEMIKIGERWMPVIYAKLKEPDNQRAFGIVANKHTYAKRANKDDIVSALSQDVNDGICPRGHDKIMLRLIEVYFGNEFYTSENGRKNPMLQRIVNEVWEETSNPDEIVRNKERDEWITWLSKTKHNHDAPNTCLMMVGGNRPEQFLTRHILPAGIKGKTAKVILYVNVKTETKAKEAIATFKREVDQLYTDMFKTVSKSVVGLDLAPPKEGWKIVGIIPQIQNEQQQIAFTDYELVSYEEYMK